MTKALPLLLLLTACGNMGMVQEHEYMTFARANDVVYEPYYAQQPHTPDNPKVCKVVTGTLSFVPCGEAKLDNHIEACNNLCRGLR